MCVCVCGECMNVMRSKWWISMLIGKVGVYGMCVYEISIWTLGIRCICIFCLISFRYFLLYFQFLGISRKFTLCFWNVTLVHFLERTSQFKLGFLFHIVAPFYRFPLLLNKTKRCQIKMSTVCRSSPVNGNKREKRKKERETRLFSFIIIWIALFVY